MLQSLGIFNATAHSLLRVSERKVDMYIAECLKSDAKDSVTRNTARVYTVCDVKDWSAECSWR